MLFFALYTVALASSLEFLNHENVDDFIYSKPHSIVLFEANLDSREIGPHNIQIGTIKVDDEITDHF
jgi:hypothetical protein